MAAMVPTDLNARDVWISGALQSVAERCRALIKA